MSLDVMRWRTPTVTGETRMEVLKKRHAILRAVREYMDGEGFLEAETPLLVHGTTPDGAIGSFELDGRYLVTSTEYQIKRLYTGGFEKVYTLTRNFRTGEKDAQHNPEFTMLEWARRGAAMDGIDADMEQILWRAHLALGGGKTLDYNGYTIAIEPPWDRLSVAEALSRASGVDVPDFELPVLCRAVDAAGIKVRPQDYEDRIFLMTLLLDHAQKGLGFEKPVFLQDWPDFLTSSAREKGGGRTIRSELFVAGLELSDGFPFMTDYERQKQTFARELDRRRIEGMPPVETDALYLEAMRAGLPDGAGMALGFDRMVMLLTGQTDIRNVLAFSWDEV